MYVYIYNIYNIYIIVKYICSCVSSYIYIHIVLYLSLILLRIRGEVSHPACCSTIPWDFEKPYKKSRFLGVLALTKSIGF